MKTIFRNFLIFAIMFYGAKTITAQEKNNSTFAIINQAGITNIQPYILAIEKANFNCYHLKKNRRKITFDTGVVVELYSLDEMHSKGVAFNSPCALDESKLQKKQPVYHLTEEGIL